MAIESDEHMLTRSFSVLHHIPLGKPRSSDFDAMLLRHPGERGVAIDHWAALVTEGDNYSVFSLEGESGSCRADGTLTADGTGSPAMWIKDVIDGAIVTTLVPSKGKLGDILRPATEVVKDERIDVIRKKNPDDS